MTNTQKKPKLSFCPKIDKLWLKLNQAQVQLGRSTLKLTAVKIKFEVEAEHSILDAVDA